MLWPQVFTQKTKVCTKVSKKKRCTKCTSEIKAFAPTPEAPQHTLTTLAKLKVKVKRFKSCTTPTGWATGCSKKEKDQKT